MTAAVPTVVEMACGVTVCPAYGKPKTISYPLATMGVIFRPPVVCVECGCEMATTPLPSDALRPPADMQAGSTEPPA